MAVIATSEFADFRTPLLSVLSTMADRRPLKILDVGGGLNPWLGPLITHSIDVDFQEVLGTNRTVGDICHESTWKHFMDAEFDFVNCTHTLCDVRDPGFVVRQLSRIGKAGFIAVPNKHSECSTHESIFYRGYGHHRYIYQCTHPDYFEGYAKFPDLSFRSPVPRKLWSLLPSRLQQSRIQKIFPRTPSWRWIRKEIANHNHEFAVIWTSSIDFRYFNSDYPGRDIDSLASLATTYLTRPVLEIPWDSGTEEQLLQAVG